MHRRPVGRGRRIVVLSAVVLIASDFLQWWQIGGGPGELAQRSGVGIGDGRGFTIFLAAVAVLLLFTLPYASDTPVAIERPLSYLLLLIITAIAFGWRVVALVQDDLVPWPPSRGLGFWLAGLGLLLFARGVFELYDERVPR